MICGVYYSKQLSGSLHIFAKFSLRMFFIGFAKFAKGIFEQFGEDGD